MLIKYEEVKMNLLLFIIVVVVSFTAVRIGAIAFELTGLEWSLSKFQALSCFTGTGFTTKEAELITGNPRRRHIASIIMILGHAGLVSLIATFANSLRSSKHAHDFLALPPLINLIIIIVFIYVIYRVFSHTKAAKKMTDVLKAHIIKRKIVKPVSFEELVVATGGYGVSNIEICKNNPLLHKTLLQANLGAHDIKVLAIQRGKETMPNPPADTKILLTDNVICFGKLDNIRKELYINK